MQSKQTEIKLNFKKNFNPHEYQRFRRNLIQNEAWLENHFYFFVWLHEFFTTEKYDNGRLLDLASGPLIHNVASASSYFSEIILSDFVKENRSELSKWLRKDPDCMNWSQFLKIVAMAEKWRDVDKACEEIEKRIRSSVKAVIHCDILKEEIIPKEYLAKPFDVIISAFTIENAVADYETYCKCLGRINRLLKKGGKLILISLVRSVGYEVGDNKFPYLSLDETQVQKALEVNGFGDIKWKMRIQPDYAKPKICDKVYFVSSTKL